MSTAFQPNAFQPDAFQVEGGVASGAITGGLDYTNRDDTLVGHAVIATDGLTSAKYGSQKKRRANPNIRFKPATAKAAPVPTQKPAAPPAPKAKPSPLVLGLVARGLALPDPITAPVLPEPAPVLVVASIPPAVVPDPAAAPPAPAPIVPTVADLVDRLEGLELQLAAMRAEIAALRQAPPAPQQEPEPFASTARDPVHEALHAMLPAIGGTIDLDAEPPAPRRAVAPPAPASAAPAPQRKAMTPEQIRAENERRAAIAVQRLLMNV